ncbi:cupin domain-containing protein [Mycobacterium paraintracellulare]|uniref:cupin domain-containing protein n=1 Tax=Mycobacterium paraintracellulare TaxID=1138383 RepID=UPI001F402295|nr:cupin domain-containing protein [Mycobacterium paraintracellulare]
MDTPAFQQWMQRFRATITGPFDREGEPPAEPMVTHSDDAVWLESDITGTPSRIGVLLDQPAHTFELYLQEIGVNGSSDMQRHVHESVHCVISGSGYSEIGSRRYEWGPGDFVYTPPFMWHRHYNAGDEVVRMILVENSAVLGFLGLNRRDSAGLVTYGELQEKHQRDNGQR